MTRRTLLTIAADLLAVFVPIWRAWRAASRARVSEHCNEYLRGR